MMKPHIASLPRFRNWSRAVLAFLSFGSLLGALNLHAAYPDRFVWVFGWGLGKDSDVAEIAQVLDTAAQHGCTGAMVSFGLDTLCKQPPDYFRRLEAVQNACEKDKLDLVPAIFSVGYGGGLLSHNRNLAEGLPVADAPFVVNGAEARLVPDESARLDNGGFEEFTGNKFKGYNFHDQPGEVSFAETQVKHSGNASLRLEHFTANPYGHGRVMQEIRVKPQRCYRVTVWVKTEGLQPANAFRLLALTDQGRELAPREFNLPSTTDWRKLTMLFNSLSFDKVRLYAGLWGGKSGKVWLDDWSVEEVGPISVLHRPGTPVMVRSEEGTTFTEGKDYAPLQNPSANPWRTDGDAAVLKLLPGSRIQDGQRLLVSWYHSMLINDSQVTVCMAEPEVYAIFDHEAKLLAERLHPRRVMLNMDEVRMGGTCRACQGRDMGQLLGECITKQAQAIRRYSPNAEVYVWSDMLDPNHNAHGHYYLVEGDFTGSWKTIPKDLVIAVWGGAPREKSLRFFADQEFKTLVACYYDAGDLNEVKGWLQLARPLPGVRGFMYTPWQKSYSLLPAFGDLLQGESGK